MKKKPKIYAIIPARGGSKRIPGKNIKDFCGKPLIAWTIEEAKKCKLIDRIIVSTDDPKIAAAAEKWGAEVPFMRPKGLAENSTPDLPVFEHALKWLRMNEGMVPDMIAHLRVNVPLRKCQDIDKGIRLLLKNKSYDSVRAVISAPLHPLKTYRLDGDNLLPFIPEEVFGIREPYNAPVQSLPKAYAAAGYFSAIWSKTILQMHSMTGKKILGYVVDSDNAVDIDTLEEFEFAEMKMKRQLSGGDARF